MEHVVGVLNVEKTVFLDAPERNEDAKGRFKALIYTLYSNM
jgi:hypothetical protein